MKIQILCMLFICMGVLAGNKHEIMLRYGKDGRALKAFVYNARNKQSQKELVKEKYYEDYTEFRGDFSNAKSVNSYLEVQDDDELRVDLTLTPVMEICLKSSTVERPVKLVWIIREGNNKKWNYQTLYFRQANVWERFVIKLDSSHRRKISMKKVNAFALQQNYEETSDIVELAVRCVTFRTPCAGDVYVDGKRPLIRVTAPFTACPADESLFSQFKFGVWGTTLGGMGMGVNDPFYCDDDDAIAGRFRANYLNSIMYPSTVWPNWADKVEEIRKKKRLESRFRPSLRDVLHQQVRSCRKYNMSLAPLTQFVPRVKAYDDTQFKSEMLPLIAELGNAPEIFGWYLTDEPNFNFMSTYNQVYPQIEEVTTKQVPFVNLCNRFTAYSYSGENSGMLVTDFYPLKSNSSFLTEEQRGKRNPWAVIDWVSEMETFASGKPHYLILSTHSFFSTVFPKDAELRLQVYLALAYGADSLFFFIPDYGPFWLFKYIDRTLQDPYGNPSKVWNTLGELGKRLIPVGGFVAGAVLDDRVKVTLRKTNPKIKVFGAERPVIESVVRRKGNRYVIFVWNNDLQQNVSNALTIEAMPKESRLFDLEGLCHSDGLFDLQPGDGKIFMITTEQDFEQIIRKAKSIQLVNERMRVLYKMEEAMGTYPAVKALETQLMQASSQQNIRQVEEKLEQLIAADAQAVELRENWEQVRQNMGKLHRLLAEKVEAPKVIMFQYETNPISALSEPGKSFIKQMFQMSLAFREIERENHSSGVCNQRREIQLMLQVSRQFLALVQREFMKKHPKACPAIQEMELLKIIGKAKWHYYQKFLRKW